MTNIDATQATVFNRGSHGIPVTDVSDGHVSHRRRNLILALIAAAVTALVIAGVQYARISTAPTFVTPTSNLAKSVQLMDAYVPGGSVYDQQVPFAARNPQDSAFLPGGSVYEQQVGSGAN